MGCGGSVDHSYQRFDNQIWRGILQVEVKDGAIKEDIQLIGKQSPYCILRFGRQIKQTQVHDNGGQFPVWKEAFQFKRTDEDDYIHVEVWNKNILKDSFIGEGGFSLCKVRKGLDQKVDEKCILYGREKEIGVINFTLKFKLDEDCKKHPEVLAPDTLGTFNIWPKQATLQKDNTGWFDSLQPTCIVRLGDQTTSSSIDDKGHLNPRWNELLILNRDEIQRDLLMVEIRNCSDQSSTNTLIGVGFLPFTPALLQNKIEKTVPLYRDGQLVGNVTVEYQFQTKQPEIYEKARNEQDTEVQQPQKIVHTQKQPENKQISNQNQEFQQNQNQNNQNLHNQQNYQNNQINYNPNQNQMQIQQPVYPQQPFIQQTAQLQQQQPFIQQQAPFNPLLVQTPFNPLIVQQQPVYYQQQQQPVFVQQQPMFIPNQQQFFMPPQQQRVVILNNQTNPNFQQQQIYTNI